MHRFFAAATGFALTIMGSSSHAQTIYPIDRAEILLGARFDLKVDSRIELFFQWPGPAHRIMIAR